MRAGVGWSYRQNMVTIYKTVVDKDSLAEEVSKDVASDSVKNVLKEIYENDVKAEINDMDEAPTSFKLYYEDKVKTIGPSRS